jgi:pimeloyl-ACP methyl ester carboxylesterase
MPQVELPQGTINYEEAGSGPVIVLIHGALVNSRLWEKVVPELARDARVIVPDLPLASHKVAMTPDADLSPPGLAKLIADFIAALGLEDVTLVANDTGGALSQLVVTRHPERIGRLVLTNCDAYENFLPPAFRYLQLLARIPGGTFTVAQTMRLRANRRLPIAYGWLSTTRIPNELLDEWVKPLLTDAGVRRDARKLLRGISKRYTIEAAAKLHEFEGPAMVIWGRKDRFFKPAHAEQLTAEFKDGRLEWIEDARTFVMLDAPERVAELVGAFAREPREAAVGV